MEGKVRFEIDTSDDQIEQQAPQIIMKKTESLDQQLSKNDLYKLQD